MAYYDMFYGAIKPIFQRAEELRKKPTETEHLIWQYLKANQLGVRFKRQHPIWMYIADFYCHELRMVIEIDGSIHDLIEVKEHDRIREDDIRSFGIKVLRFTNKDIRTNIEEVLIKIKWMIQDIKSENQTSRSRIAQMFASSPLGAGGHGILNVYCTAGFPQLDSTMQVMQALQANGADIIELGMPYSDPLADGPVIQQSSMLALANGMTIKELFEQLKTLRPTIHVPVILMGYMNPVLQYGFENFCAAAAAAGVDGLILPDLPEYEFETEYGSIIKKYGLDFIFLVTPETSVERVRKLDALSSGFLYAVSSSSTTGSNKNMTDVTAYLKGLQALKLNNPVLVGFGIKDKQSFDTACAHANGAIIGTAFIKALEGVDDVEAATASFLKNVLQ